MALQIFKIAEVTVASPQANIEFTSIPQGYTDLLLTNSTRRSAGNVWGSYIIRFNNDTSSTYTARQLQGNGSTATSASYSTVGSVYLSEGTGNGSTANTFDNAQVYIPNYSSTTINKSFMSDGVGENNATTAYATLLAGLYPSTSAITRIDVISGSENFMTNSTFTLYGIL